MYLINLLYIIKKISFAGPYGIQDVFIQDSRGKHFPYKCSRYPSREIRNNSCLQFNRLFNNRGTASTPTRPQSVGGNYSPASALKPRLEHT